MILWHHCYRTINSHPFTQPNRSSLEQDVARLWGTHHAWATTVCCEHTPSSKEEGCPLRPSGLLWTWATSASFEVLSLACHPKEAFLSYNFECKLPKSWKIGEWCQSKTLCFEVILKTPLLHLPHPPHLLWASCSSLGKVEQAFTT